MGNTYIYFGGNLSFIQLHINKCMDILQENFNNQTQYNVEII